MAARTGTSFDSELLLMGRINRQLAVLSPAARQRILAYLQARADDEVHSVLSPSEVSDNGTPEAPEVKALDDDEEEDF